MEKTLSTTVSELAISAMGGSADAKAAYIESRNQILEAADTISAIESTPAGAALVPQSAFPQPANADVYNRVKVEKGIFGLARVKLFGTGASR